MNLDLRVAAEDYVRQRRARGYKFVDSGALLVAFAEELHDRRIERVTVAEALAFAQRSRRASRSTHARRLGVIRNWTVWLRATDPAAAEVLAPGLIRDGYQRVNPYLYSEAQTLQLMEAARQLQPGFLAEAMYVLIGLLYVTGLRSGEAFSLSVGDFDQDQLVLHVKGKLDRRRLVPVRPSTADKLNEYCGERRSGPLLVGPKGGPIAHSTVQAAFRRLVLDCELVPQPGARHPRLHDFRHSLAVDTLVEAHRHGLDVDGRLAVLSTFLGHADALNTYWYLTASPELMAVVSDRIAASLGRWTS
ncbi:MAG: tyrosine-type recombinase/integrase [Acidimicrobiales bacterium]